MKTLLKLILIILLLSGLGLGWFIFGSGTAFSEKTNTYSLLKRD